MNAEHENFGDIEKFKITDLVRDTATCLKGFNKD